MFEQNDLCLGAIQKIGDKINGLRQRESFTHNLAVTFSGNALAQIIGVAFTPFIARIYGPQAYGVFALFMAVVSSLSPLSTLQFPSGYVAAPNRDEFFRIVKITLYVLVTGSAIFFGVVFFWGQSLTSYFQVSELNPLLFWMPVYFLFMGLDHILLGWNICEKEFRRGAVAKLMSVILSKSSAIVLGLYSGANASGLMLSNLIVYPTESFVKLSKRIVSGLGGITKQSSWKELHQTFLNFKGYAFFVTPGLFVTNLSNQLPVYCFSIVFHESVVGFYALANSVVNMPLSVIVNSSTTVFLQKAAETMRTSTDDLKKLVLSLYQRLFWIGFTGLVVLAFISKWIFGLVFGDEWIQAGGIASLLCIGVIFSVPGNPLNVLYRLMGYEKTNFAINLIFLFVKVLGIGIGLYINSVEVSVIGFSVATLLQSVVLLYVTFSILNIPRGKLLRDLIITVALFVLIVALRF
ncbi:MAG: hypothetical protein BroJett042_10130 [Bacteroidota bacterium]|nr:MAG: hypothetical protein BroJett042_10130 [Bacteroidota bacterium]